VRDLLHPDAYPPEERPARVELVETHISWLFLTGQYVYKVKKPVDFGFLDFTTPERRRHFCQEEVRLNRRLSPSVYLGVVEVRWDGARHTLAGPGAVVDYAVKMVQLPRERTLAALLREGKVSEAQIREVARRIAAFHAAADTGPAITAMGGLDTVRYNVRENFAQTERYVGLTLSPEAYDLLWAYSEAFMDVHAPLFTRRQAQGRVRDGHGDLHAGQIYLVDGVLFLDCIEFNERFRWADVCADLAFLAMDLDFHGHPSLAHALGEEYRQASGDEELFLLLDFYKAYRAYVRGKVESFRLDQPGLPEEERRAVVQRASRYFALAEGYARAPLRGPLLVLLTGLIGSGKSTLARRLAPLLRGEVISSDEVRKALAGLPPTARRWEAWGTGLYSPEMDRRTYAAMGEKAHALLREGKVVVLDASYRTAWWRREALAVADALGAPAFVVEVTAPEDALQERLRRRQEEPPGPSDGRLDILAPFREHFEPLTDIPPGRLVRVDTSRPPRETARAALEGLFRLALRARPLYPSPETPT
jgi:aminoglycoside phosphotransferase family enzyme/predicted kinase